MNLYIYFWVWAQQEKMTKVKIHNPSRYKTRKYFGECGSPKNRSQWFRIGQTAFVTHSTDESGNTGTWLVKLVKLYPELEEKYELLGIEFDINKYYWRCCGVWRLLDLGRVDFDLCVNFPIKETSLRTNNDLVWTNFINR